jgi:hypothetical protein
VRLDELLNFHKNRCEIPPAGGAHRKNFSFMDGNKFLFFMKNMVLKPVLNFIFLPIQFAGFRPFVDFASLPIIQYLKS